ncbi:MULTISPECIES: CBS domain-containing protein [unclassified Agromyces]|uniref:CBS domain-containing protein n=1 Tax=unclassified Agromyces TaxID=2639701 RepID=UPI0007B30BD0|nr:MULTISPECIES: CBS domain-containing protein [unclassified Agromyces]KZE95353.1 Hypoxic response protein 1 [Agromyces sp. NDB4Y10]MCK8609300.1 CBS domain-containing protein [Agromyces sp. C10]
MTVARDLMTPDPTCVKEDETLVDAARKMRDLDVGALPICGNDDRLKGMLTDRDIVVKCIADGGDPSSVTAGSLAEGKPVTVGADDDIREALEMMQQHQVRRLPVIDGHDLVGIISQADIARSLSAGATGETVAEISED